jgi:hypothetical protein
MPTTEFIEWQAYFEIYPFSLEHSDWQHAQMMAIVINDGLATRTQAAGKTSFRSVDAARFVPDYLGIKPKAEDKSLEQQAQELKAFKRSLQGAQENNGT